MADDLSFVALADLSRVLTEEDSHRIIGGHMITVLAARWGLGPELYRETRDADLGRPTCGRQAPGLVDALSDIGYRRLSGNRFVRTVTDIPVRLAGEAVTDEAVIDILIPAYTSRPRSNRRLAPHLSTTEVPGLGIAFRREPVKVPLQLQRLNGEMLSCSLAFADEVSALALKAKVMAQRYSDTDSVDVWRCLEIAYAAGVGPEEFAEGSLADAAAVVRRLFASPDGRGMRELVRAQRLSERAATERYTRIRALIARVLGAE